MFEKFSYSNYYRVLATVPCHPCQNSFDEKLIICWNNFKYANFVILCPVNSLVSRPGHHLVLLRLQSSRSHPVHHLEKECKKKKNKLESFLMNHGGTDSEKNTDIGQLSALSLSLPKIKTTNLSELASLLNGFSIQTCPRLREALVKHLSTFQAPPPEVLHLRDCLRLDHHLIICWATFPRTRYHLQDFLPVCIFGGGPHGRVLSKVRHPSGKAKVNHVPLDQILVPL